ncbi:hypothetical protein [Natronohydrobacter thiooxidans]|nr:hypothetical protein [Natronohydrobacter thiooxidans]
MKPVALVIALALLAACGAEAPPTAPEPTGLSLSGEARIGVSGRL